MVDYHIYPRKDVVKEGMLKQSQLSKEGCGKRDFCNKCIFFQEGCGKRGIGINEQKLNLSKS
jgi:hypothetical protein